ncbi:S8 family serine peptidase [bacterium]|nr:S8 family serine peptidase [bacterium]MDB4526745.1 S8 family serine peptidase [bacterium]MDB4566751.1 S8 family serine peptidase [Akkermansiaceae bacterium]MDB4572815.1 S8 family serine peptidase [Akkermansiaceae bacterium]
MKFSLSRIFVISVFTLSSLLAQDEPRKIADSDGDGWCDLWCDLFKEIEHRDKSIDSDGDGVTDFNEMLAMTNPTTVEQNLSDAEKARLAKIRSERKKEILERKWPARKALLDQTLVEGFAPGKKAVDPEIVRSDNAKWRQKMENRKAKALAKNLETEAKLNAIARKYGVKRADEKGTLVGESENGPIFMAPQDAISANTIFADDLWPTGLYNWQDHSQSRGLTGAGITVPIWEANETVPGGGGGAGVLETHSEFDPGNRADLLDTTPVSHHANAVASTIIGGARLDVFRGATNLGKLIRGVAYEGSIDSYDLADFETETSDAVLAGQIFSNHSYGTPGGWETIQIGGTVHWFWRFSEFDEDPRLGIYSPSNIGGTASEDFDEFVETSEIHLPVLAAGNPNNDGPGVSVTHKIIQNGFYVDSNATRDWLNGEDSFDSLLSPATAKNVLTVGSIEDQAGPNIFFSNFSGAGPTDDGRIKPDLVAVGQRNPDLNLGNSLFEANRNNNFSYYNGLTNVNGTINLDGTSFAAPSVTGGLMLAEERRQELFPTASPLLASTWRAAAIHTVSALGNGGPNYRSGWGIFNAVNIAQLLEDEESVGRGSLMKEFTINSGASKTFYVTVPSNTQAGFTLAWSDPAGSPPAFGTIVDDDTAMLVNDLDLVVIDEVANPVTTYFPWTLNPDLVGEDPALRGAPAVRTSTDNRNNVEKVTVDASAQERRLKTTVSPNGALQGGSQKVSLILSGVQLDDPQITGSGFTQNPNNADEFSVTVSTDPGAFYTLETSFNLENGSWSDVATFKAEDSTTTVLTNRNSAQSKQFWRVRRGE